MYGETYNYWFFGQNAFAKPFNKIVKFWGQTKRILPLTVNKYMMLPDILIYVLTKEKLFLQKLSECY